METKLFQYFANRLSEQEISEVEAWIASSDENQKTAQQLYWLYYASETLEIMQSVDTKTALSKVRRNDATIRRRVILNRISRIAAMLLIPVAAIALWALCDNRKCTEEVQYVELRTTSGMVSSVTLPDNSKVWLNSNSYLKYPMRFEDERRVELVGEGYFKVSKDENKRFLVQTKVMEVEVLGTEFNVDAYERSGRDVHTTLVKGSINMTFDDNDNRQHTVKVYPGQCVAIDPTTKNCNIRKVDTTGAASWKDGRIVFNKTPFVEALRMIENRFNVEFVVKNHVYYEHNFTGMFTDQRLDVILEHFKRSSKMRFKTIENYNSANIKGREIIEIY